MQRLNLRTALLALLLASTMPGVAQPTPDPLVEAYIDMYRDAAIREMLRTGVPAAIKLAQGILETAAGSSSLARQSNNHFGIKCKSSWTGDRVFHDDDEKGECFRKYTNPEESYRDHSDFLRHQPRYAFLFTLDPTDYRGWAQGLKQAGYATNPRYPEMLVQYIETYGLDGITRDVIAGRTGNGGIRKEDPIVRTPPLPTERSVDAPRSPTHPTPAAADSRPPAPTATASTGWRLLRPRTVFVGKGTSLLAVAEAHGVPLARLLEWNDIAPESEILPQDRLIRLRKNVKGHNPARNRRWTRFGSTTSLSSPISGPAR
jgi:hypothetical protein